jgi:hypothetical protein
MRQDPVLICSTSSADSSAPRRTLILTFSLIESVRPATSVSEACEATCETSVFAFACGSPPAALRYSTHAAPFVLRDLDCRYALPVAGIPGRALAKDTRDGGRKPLSRAHAQPSVSRPAGWRQQQRPTPTPGRARTPGARRAVNRLCVGTPQRRRRERFASQGSPRVFRGPESRATLSVHLAPLHGSGQRDCRADQWRRGHRPARRP